MKKLLTVLGARPQFIKAGAVSAAIARHGGLAEVLVHTGQHYDANMSDVFFEEFGLPAPAHHLGIGSGSHGAQTGRMLMALEEVAGAEAPDGIMVYGDTNSTLAGALVAAKADLPLIHVEAGLRSFNRAMPEEINRVMTDAVSTLLLAPSPAAAAQLAREGVAAEKIAVTGDVMYDAALAAAERGRGSALPAGLAEGGYRLATVHRAENTDDPARLGWILDLLADLAADMPLVLPLHPRTRAAMARHGLERRAGAVTLIEPVGYAPMMRLAGAAQAVVTDSGGLQKEAFFLGKPVHVLRTETEWVELVETGWAGLLPPGGTEPAAAAAAIRSRGARPGNPCDAYGTGQAAAAVTAALARHLGA